jgi:hypothetical protein
MIGRMQTPRFAGDPFTAFRVTVLQKLTKNMGQTLFATIRGKNAIFMV